MTSSETRPHDILDKVPSCDSTRIQLTNITSKGKFNDQVKQQMTLLKDEYYKSKMTPSTAIRQVKSPIKTEEIINKRMKTSSSSLMSRDTNRS